jgi:hypothetical protein
MMRKGIMVVVVIAILAVVGYVIYNAAHSVQKDVQTPTGNIDIARDQAAKSNLVNIKMAIQSYTATNGQLPPAADQATLGGFMNPWPANPWTKVAMTPGTGKGDYSYTPRAGTSFTLTVHLSDGKVASAPGGSTHRARCRA